jgi:hypothetical protein
VILILSFIFNIGWIQGVDTYPFGCFGMQKCGFRSKNADLDPKMQTNLINAERCRKIQLMQKNAEKLNKFRKIQLMLKNPTSAEKGRKTMHK